MCVEIHEHEKWLCRFVCIGKEDAHDSPVSPVRIICSGGTREDLQDRSLFLNPWFRVLLNFIVHDGTTKLTLVRHMAHGLKTAAKATMFGLLASGSGGLAFDASASLSYFRDITRFSEEVAEEYRARYRKMHSLVVTAHRAEREVSAREHRR